MSKNAFNFVFDFSHQLKSASKFNFESLFYLNEGRAPFLSTLIWAGKFEEGRDVRMGISSFCLALAHFQTANISVLPFQNKKEHAFRRPFIFYGSILQTQSWLTSCPLPHGRPHFGIFFFKKIPFFLWVKNSAEFNKKTKFLQNMVDRILTSFAFPLKVQMILKLPYFEAAIILSTSSINIKLAQRLKLKGLGSEC